MADIKITALVEDTAPSLDDLILMVNNPGVSPATRKATIQNLWNTIRFQDMLGAINVCKFMDGVAGRPTYATWFADQAMTNTDAVWTAAKAATPLLGTVLIPPGRYLVTSLVWDTRINLQGIGSFGADYSGAEIFSNTAAVPVLSMPDPMSGIKISNINIRANVNSTACVDAASLLNGTSFDRVFMEASGCPYNIIVKGGWLWLRDLSYLAGAAVANICNTGTGAAWIYLDSLMVNTGATAFYYQHNTTLSPIVHAQNLYLESSYPNVDLFLVDSAGSHAYFYLSDISTLENSAGNINSLVRKIASDWPSSIISSGNRSWIGWNYIFKDDVDAVNTIPWGAAFENFTYFVLPRHYQPNGFLSYFTASDATPNISTGDNFMTNNAAPTTITNFLGGYIGCKIVVFIRDDFTTIDFTGTNLKGNVGVDWTPANGDWMDCIYDGTNWYCAVHKSS